MTAVTGFGFVRTIETKTYHNEKKRSGESGGQVVAEELMDGFAFENAPLEFGVEEAGWNSNGDAIGKPKSVGIGHVFAKAGEGRKCAPDGGL
jgi:hypothetical protein